MMFAMLMEWGTLRYNGHRISALRMEPEGAEKVRTAVVFLHDALGSIAQWRDFPEVLCSAAGLPGLVYERLGHGGSDPLPGPRTARYLHDEALLVLPQVLDSSRIERAILFGHSDGGSIALLFASAFPDRTAGVVTEAAHVFADELTLAGLRAARERYERGGFVDKLEKYHGEKARALFHAWNDTWLDPSFSSWNIESVLGGIHAPTLVIQGENDEYGTPAQVEAIAREVKGESEKLFLPGCGHVPHHETRERVVAAFLAHLRRLKI
ncbi:MAG: 2-succinyl-6-hydroxy-2,4-cyclohexadiene-1-carboxylate synthase [Thermoanaerobaculia bacterium]|nr:2-succinyl-6-hydroxy-2,4-cyclohexadiene-1-carboxylate synthase [Thermoanaerobaculia bacterium]